MFKYQKELNEYLYSKSDKTYDYSFNDETIGVRIPIVESIAKEIKKADLAITYLDSYEKTNFESDVIYGMLCGIVKLNEQQRKYYLHKFIVLVDSWATCDLSVARWKFIKKEKDDYKSFIIELLESNDPWYQRVAYVILLSYYLDDDYVDFSIDCLKKPMKVHYYTEMAAAWLISMGLVKQKEKYLELLNQHEFTDFVYQKGLQKAVESFRSSKEDKALYRKMKKERRLLRSTSQIQSQ